MKEVLKNTLNLGLSHDLDTFDMDDTKSDMKCISVAGFGGLSERGDSR